MFAPDFKALNGKQAPKHFGFMLCKNVVLIKPESNTGEPLRSNRELDHTHLRSISLGFLLLTYSSISSNNSVLIMSV